MTLGDARSKRNAAKKILAAGSDPGVIKKAQKYNAGGSFKAVAEELVAKHAREGRAPRTMEKLKWLLGLAFPVIGDRPVAQITAPELLAVLRTAETRGRYETARRLRSTCGTVNRYRQGQP